MKALVKYEPITDEDVARGVDVILAALGRGGDELTHLAFDRALTGQMSRAEWEEVQVRAVRDRDERRIWWKPGDLLAILDRIREEQAQDGEDARTEAHYRESLEDARRR